MESTIIDDYLLQKKLEGVKGSTLSNYSYKLTANIVPCFTNGIMTSEKELLKSISMKQQELKSKPYFDFVILLNNFLRFLYSKQYTEELFKVPCPKIKKSRIDILTNEEKGKMEKYLIDNLDYFHFGILLSLYTGIRLGELSACQISDIDDNGILRITKTLQRIKNLDKNAETKTIISIDTPKTENSVRDIPVPTFIIDLFNALPNKKSDCYLLTNTKKYIEPTSIERKFKKILTLCNIKDTNFHILRHTFATDCIKAGFDSKTLSEILGHSDVKITLDRYVHSSLELKAENMNKLCPTTKSIKV